jgi:hypothetical protein
MPRFLQPSQIATAINDPNSLSPSTSGTSPIQTESDFVYDSSGRLGATNADAWRNLSPPPPVVGNLGNIQTPERETWYSYLALGNQLISTARNLNNINPYPLPPLASGTPYEDYIATRKTLLEMMSIELNDLEAKISAPLRPVYDAILRSGGGTRFQVESNIYIDDEATFDSMLRGPVFVPLPPALFSFYLPTGSTLPPYGDLGRYVALRIVIRLYALHNVLLGSDLTPTGFDLVSVRCDPRIIPKILGNIDAALNVFREAIDDYPDEVQRLLDEGTEAQQEELEGLLGDVAPEFTFVESLTSGEINAISQQEAYKQYFATTFNEELITTIPLIQNLYLTEKYFSGVTTAMLPPKRAALSVLLNTINNDEQFQMEPDLSRPSSTAAIKEATGNFDVDAREFILKMIIQTPISILKGLVELIDPHVAITKIIKIGSATAFNEGIEYLNPVAQQIKAQLAAEGIPNNLTGQRLMEVVLCLIEAGFETTEEAIEALLPPDMAEVPGDLLPSVSLDGIDFTGTIPGMFMIPPSPFGLLYLLLELVKNAIGETENVSDAGTRTEEC